MGSKKEYYVFLCFSCLGRDELAALRRWMGERIFGRGWHEGINLELAIKAINVYNIMHNRKNPEGKDPLFIRKEG